MKHYFIEPGLNGGIINIEQAHSHTQHACNITLNKIECRRCSCCCCFLSVLFCFPCIRSFIHSFIHSWFSFLPFSPISAAAAVVDVVLTNLFTICMILYGSYGSFVCSLFHFLTINSRPFGTVSGIYIYLLSSVGKRTTPYAVHVYVHNDSCVDECVSNYLLLLFCCCCCCCFVSFCLIEAPLKVRINVCSQFLYNMMWIQ